MTIDLHQKPFDDETLAKLKLYENYLDEWIPVFISMKTNFNIYDFFCGPGKDNNEIEGSPFIALKALLKWKEQIQNENLQAVLYLNEYDTKKFKTLKSYFKNLNPAQGIKIILSNEDFKDSYEKHYTSMRNASDSRNCPANLLFLDQNGVKQVDKIVFQKMLYLEKTDFIFFISSSYLNRFKEEFRWLGLIDEHFSKNYFHCHRAVLEGYKALVPSSINAYLAQFTLRKGTNIYGLIYGSKNLLGIYKFVKCCWDVDPVRGEANFNIDGDNFQPEQGHLFEEHPQPTKITVFERELREAVLNRELKTNRDVYKFALERGCMPSKHAGPVFKQLKAEKKLQTVPKLGREVHKKNDEIPLNLL